MRQRFHVEVKGIVQGVGYRPFVYALASSYQLGGWVYNHSRGVAIEIEGETGDCQAFLADLQTQAPTLAVVDAIDAAPMAVQDEVVFSIRASEQGEKDTLVPADMGVCADCLAEIRDPQNRRYRYPFTNCTNCGPRFTIIRDLPYDRRATTMEPFFMCPDCYAEYRDPKDRRFHAQPNACPVCGPQAAFRTPDCRPLAGDPFAQTYAALQQGKIVAVKGMGGYHLVCDAENAAAVETLRARKYRYAKPFALMMEDVAAVQQYCLVSEEEAALLTSQRRPIVLLKKRPDGKALPEAIAPGNGRLGVMLPYTPLHYLLMEQARVLVMTSGNRSDEPILYDDYQAVAGLMEIADFFLTYNRRIQRRCDDSVLVYAAGSPRFLRRSRGWAPQPLRLPAAAGAILACGGEQKNTFCLTRGRQAFLSQHIGDLNNDATLASYEREIADFIRMFASKPELIAYDLHPEYLSTRYAHTSAAGAKKIGVQHHHAHLASVLAEHSYAGDAIGLIFDGTGFGLDGTLWGGEVLVGNCARVERLRYLRPFALPGGEAAIRAPWRVALSLLLAACEDAAAAAPEGLLPPGWELVAQAIAQGVNAPLSSGMGRLFDAVAALVGIGREVFYEGQAAVELEQILDEGTTDAYTFALAGAEIDWRPVIRQVAADVQVSVPAAVISARFHRAVTEMAVAVCTELRTQSGLSTVALSGGCWQNVWLLEQTTALLEEAGFLVLLNKEVPSNDGGISYGQAAVAAALWEKGEV